MCWTSSNVSAGPAPRQPAAADGRWIGRQLAELASLAAESALLAHDQYRAHFKQIQRVAGMDAAAHQRLRRTFASWLAEAGVPELVHASLMGHANSSTVRRVYARTGSAAQVDAVGLLPQLYG